MMMMLLTQNLHSLLRSSFAVYIDISLKFTDFSAVKNNMHNAVGFIREEAAKEKSPKDGGKMCALNPDEHQYKNGESSWLAGGGNMQCWNWQVGVDMVIPWPIWGQKLQITWGLAAKKNMTIVDFRFSLFIILGPFETTGRKQCSWTLSLKYWSFSFDMTSRLPKHYSDLPRHPPDTFQTHSRHVPDTGFLLDNQQ